MTTEERGPATETVADAPSHRRPATPTARNALARMAILLAARADAARVAGCAADDRLANRG
jgi:hypothetical protein